MLIHCQNMLRAGKEKHPILTITVDFMAYGLNKDAHTLVPIYFRIRVLTWSCIICLSTVSIYSLILSSVKFILFRYRLKHSSCGELRTVQLTQMPEINNPVDNVLHNAALERLSYRLQNWFCGQWLKDLQVNVLANGGLFSQHWIPDSNEDPNTHDRGYFKGWFYSPKCLLYHSLSLSLSLSLSVCYTILPFPRQYQCILE
jgi:hypothetical protein